MRKSVIIGTAGHIDHGKTALVKALTGVETDRLAEEKRRGITIDLGFAHWDASPELRLSFIDVPGHERFVRNMMAGAAGVDVALLVIAADESIKPQTREHLAICRLLGVREYVVALTKSDLAPPDMLEVARMEAEELFAGGAQPPIVAVSARTGQGLTDLCEALQQTALRARRKDERGLFRLPIDRAFVKKGFGAVVTGTLMSGTVAPGDEVELHPAGRTLRVRGVQAHGETTERARAGERAAINLAGVGVSDLARGRSLTTPGTLLSVERADCVLELLPGAPPLEHGAPLHLHVGSAETTGRVLLLEREPGVGRRRRRLEPGGVALARLEWSGPLPVVWGDRFVVRRFSPVETIGGGAILDNAAPRREPWPSHEIRLRALAGLDLEQAVAAVAAGARYGSSWGRLTARLGRPGPEIRAAAKRLAERGLARMLPDRVVSAERWQAALQTIQQRLADYHREHSLEPGAPRGPLRTAPFPAAPAGYFEALLEELAASQRVVVEGELVRLASHGKRHSAAEQTAHDLLLERYERAGLEPPRFADVAAELPVDAGRARTLLRNLLREGALVEASPELIVARSALQGLETRLAERKAADPWLTVGDLKTLAGLSRKYAIPLLELLDQRGVTRREGDRRRIL